MHAWPLHYYSCLTKRGYYALNQVLLDQPTHHWHANNTVDYPLVQSPQFSSQCRQTGSQFEWSRRHPPYDHHCANNGFLFNTYCWCGTNRMELWRRTSNFLTAVCFPLCTSWSAYLRHWGCIPTNYEFPNCFIGFQSQNNEKHHSDAKAFPQGKTSALQIGYALC